MSSLSNQQPGSPFSEYSELCKVPSPDAHRAGSELGLAAPHGHGHGHPEGPGGRRWGSGTDRTHG